MYGIGSKDASAVVEGSSKTDDLIYFGSLAFMIRFLDKMLGTQPDSSGDS